LKTKICIVSPVIPPDFSGAGKRAFNQAKHMAANGYKVTVLTATKNYQAFNNLDIISIVLPGYCKNKKITGVVVNTFYKPFLLIKILYVMKVYKFDIIHCFSANKWFSLLSILSAKLAGAKTITEVTLLGSDDPMSIKKSRFGSLKLKIYNLTDVIVNISPLLLEKSKEIKLNSKAYVIGNFVDTIEFSTITLVQKNKLREKLGLSPQDFILLHVGIIRERKGIKDLIDMFCQVNKLIENAKLVLVGPLSKDEENITYSLEIRMLIEKHNLKSKVIMPGEVNNVNEWMKAADVFVFASKREGFGTVLIEAMSTGLPVVAMSIPKITDFIIRNNYDGIIVENVLEFSNAVIKLYNDKEFYNFVAHNAVNTAKSRFRIDVIMNQYYDLYHEIL